jgi:hypothetical protein
MMYNLKYLEYHKINKKGEIINVCFKVLKILTSMLSGSYSNKF